MQTFTTLLSLCSRVPAVAAFALVMAFAFSGPVVFTTSAHAGDGFLCFMEGFTSTSTGECR
ncbi:MAG: hypothetical protein V6Z81_07570 [Parvularculales bacterium]